ncbi:MAG: proton-conducting transporter membrane subunit [Candidatus Bathyarchaeota archaeon]|nr:proton-conducting transporter membrane subunit [Candidatus Bathyarchaeota archaeon]
MLPYAPWLCWLIPIIGTAVTPLVGAIRRKFSSYLAVLSIGMSALFSLSMIPDIYLGTAQLDLTIPWISNSIIQVGVCIDPLSVLMVSVITCIGFLVTIFSVAYMQKEPSLTRFWFLIQLFIGGYVVIVMADNLLFMFIGWEIVGICCTGLAAFWYKDPKKAHIGLKTFLVLHIADVLLLASILIIYTYSGTLNITELSQNNNWMGELSRAGLLFITALMFFGGAVGKAAQFPLQEWLPDALAASPSCFNALTECLAGPFLMARVLPIFHEASLMGYSGMVNFFIVMTFVGALTAIISALIAMVQVNIFKALSYSISSVIGYMMAAFGLAGLMTDMSWGYLAGTFLLMVDAFVSALLFLTAAYISYAVGSDNLHHMGGFKSRIAHRSFEVGALALAGIPPLSGFWCTNWIQTVAWDFAAEAGIKGQFMLMISGYVIFALLIIGAGITAFYGLRMMGLVFKKGSKSEEKMVKKIPSLMRISLVATLAITIFLDFLALLLIPSFNKFFLSILGTPTFSNIADVLMYIVPSISTVLTCVAVAVGGYPAYQLYVAGRVNPVKLIEEHRFLGKVYVFLWKRCYIDAFYHKVADGTIAFSNIVHRRLELSIDSLNYAVASFFRKSSKFVYTYLELNIDASNYGVAGLFRRLSSLMYKYPELRGIDALNYFLARFVTSFARRFRKTHTGVLSYNMLTAFVGAIILIILLLLFGGIIP